jgi:hypothetical protein
VAAHGSAIRVIRLLNTKLSLLTISILCVQCSGEGSFYYGFRIHRLRLVKNLTPLWVSPIRKIVRALESKFALLDSTT